MTSYELPSSVSDEMTKYFEPHLNENPSNFVCVYGSSLYKKGPDSRSDIDLFVATTGGMPTCQLSLSSMAHFVREMHARLGRKIDEEVPYETKLQYSVNEIASAISYSGFEVAGGSITVPKVVKEKSFLTSPQIKARLALNALTTPHAVFGMPTGRSWHSAVRELAEDSVTLLAASLVGGNEFDHQSLYDALVVSKDGQTGEMYLGYKTEHVAVQEHLNEVLENGAERLSRRNVLRCSGETIHLVDRGSFNPAHAMSDACDILMQNLKKG